MTTRTPQAQPRNLYHRDWGNYASLAVCPKASGTAVPLTSTSGRLEEGDTAMIIGAGPCYCVSPGTIGVNDAVWAQVAPSAPGLLYDMPINVASVGTPRRMNTAGGGFLSTVAPAVAVINSLALPSRSALSLTANVQGGYTWPVLHGLTLPAAGYVLDVEIDVFGGAAGQDGSIVPLLDLVEPTPGNPTVAGIQLLSRGAGNTLWASVMNPTVGYVNPGSPFVTLTGWATPPSIASTTRGPVRMVTEVRRLASQTPAQWALLVTTYSSGSGAQVIRNAFSGVSDPQPGLDGRPLTTIGLGMWNDTGGSIAMTLNIVRLRIFSLSAAPFP